MHKVILVDDHYIVRQGLEFLLSTVDDLSVLKGFKDGATFLSYLKNNERFEEKYRHRLWWRFV